MNRGQLSRTFTFYSTHDRPKDCFHITEHQFRVFARDCRITGPGALLPEDAALTFKKLTTRATKVAPGAATPHSVLKNAPLPPPPKTSTDRGKMNYEDFLEALRLLSLKL